MKITYIFDIVTAFLGNLCKSNFSTKFFWRLHGWIRPL